MATRLSAVAGIVRRHDPDRFLATLFAPGTARETLFLLYAFNHEIARAPETAREPMAALIRLQWWREVVEGAARRHEVAEPLGAALAAGRLDRGALSALIEAREREVEPSFATLAEWRAHLFAGAGGLAVAAGQVLGADRAPALAAFGAAYGAGGILRSVAFQARLGRVLLPEEVLAAHRLSAAAVAANPEAPALGGVKRALAAEAARWLSQARALGLPRAAVPAALPAVLAARDLAWPERAERRGLGARFAVLAAAWRGRV